MLEKIFTSKAVETIGLILTFVAAFALLKGEARISVVALFAIYNLADDFPGWFGFLKNFAKVPAWPKFVSAALIALIAGAVGGWPAVAVISGLATTGVGQYYDALY